VEAALESWAKSGKQLPSNAISTTQVFFMWKVNDGSRQFIMGILNIC
jgi:hypothetical protein